jgi:uncharacterized protein (DUF3820 family)
MYPSTVPPSIPFGRHKGKPLDTVPASYLDWLLRECKLSSEMDLLDRLCTCMTQGSYPRVQASPSADPILPHDPLSRDNGSALMSILV